MTRLTRRELIGGGLAAGAAAVTLPSRSLFKSVNDEVGLGFISCGGRAGGLMNGFSKIDGVRIAGLCDPDRKRLDGAKKKFPKASTWTDLRGLLDDKNIDAVVVATGNHWHCLASIWAMEAGKDVYVEKPLSHSQWEGQQLVAAARKYGRVCQIGTQQRSDPMQERIKKHLHEKRTLGEMQWVRVNRYGVRKPIGKRSAPLPIPDHVDHDLWLGPAKDEPLYRDKLHYDWHWDWNTGSGEMGNWGVHIVDDVRNNVFLDRVAFPKRVIAGGGRVAWNDAGNTPNVHFAWFDTGSIPMILGLCNVTATPDGKGAAPHPGPGSGYIVHCEGGRLEGQRGRAVLFDDKGKVIEKLSGNGGGGHDRNFIDAVRQRDPSLLTAPVEVGHQSTGWCNLANIAYQAGGVFSRDAAARLVEETGQWNGLVGSMAQLLDAHGIDIESDQVKLGPVLDFDPENQRFRGNDLASGLLRREYRRGFEVPEIAG